MVVYIYLLNYGIINVIGDLIGNAIGVRYFGMSPVTSAYVLRDPMHAFLIVGLALVNLFGIIRKKPIEQASIMIGNTILYLMLFFGVIIAIHIPGWFAHVPQ